LDDEVALAAVFLAAGDRFHLIVIVGAVALKAADISTT
jgi:hypothetical protein